MVPALNGGVRFAYETPWLSFAMGWSVRTDHPHRLALGSCLETEQNWIQVVELSEETQRLEPVAGCEHQYPPTKIMWGPDAGEAGKPELLGSTGTTLNLWRVE